MLYLCVQNLSVIINLQVVMLFGNGAALRSIYYYRGYIYYFGLSNGMAQLCRMDKSGTTREVIGELIPNDGVDSIRAVFQGNTLYI